jgi:von Willebrand factor type A domain-containing protein
MNDAKTITPNETTVLPVTHPEVWFLLDRSGSMQSIASDVVGGFNQFFADQRAQAGHLRVTVVQFDNEAPHEVLIDRADVANVVDLDAHRYKPRGMTPLFDAIDLLLDRAERAGGSPTDQLVVVFTDGLENASHRASREGVFAHIARLKDAGWTFVFLGANQDSYAAGDGLGVAAGSVSNFRADGQGVQVAFSSVSRGTSEWRGKSKSRRHAERDEFWGGRKEAEETPSTQ